MVEICPMVCFTAQTRIAKQFKFTYWNCYHCLELEKRIFFVGNISLSQCFYVAQFTCHMTSRGMLFTLVVRITMSTSMFLLLLVNVLCFAQNLRCTTTVSCDSKVKRS